MIDKNWARNNQLGYTGTSSWVVQKIRFVARKMARRVGIKE